MAGSNHCLAVTKAGEIFSWGFNISYWPGKVCSGKTDNEKEGVVEAATLINSKMMNGNHVVLVDAGDHFSATASAANA